MEPTTDPGVSAVHRPRSDAITATRQELALFICAFSIIAGAIHVEAAIGHFEETWLYSGFFASLAVLQLVWGVRVYSRPAPNWLRLGSAVSLAVVGIWLVSRTVGIPFGPEALQPEAVGPLDAAATVDELAIAGICFLLLEQGLPAMTSVRRLASYVFLTTTTLALFLGNHSAH